ncbi:MAG: hypothetical protein P3B98_02945 [Gemmatimonadota bacterium]|nr:hypothetical protein [Gemmatimonadota bacterium]
MIKSLATIIAGACIVAVSPSLLSGRAERLTQQGASVRTRLGVEVGRLAGVVGSPAMTIEKFDGKKVEARSTPVVRANAAWQLRVTLAAPVDPKLTVTVEGDDRGATLSAKNPSAIVAVGNAPCQRCEVELEWSFTLASPVKGGKKATVPTLPVIRYTAEPQQ